jgi:hypothetical protein
MSINTDTASTFHGVRMLEEALASTGFSVDEIEVILDSELDTSCVLEYITAVRRNRMN